jgi:alpha-glucosidase
VLLASASAAEAGWASLGRFEAAAGDGAGLVLRGAQGIVSVRALSPEVVRVRFSPTTDFGRDHSYAVVGGDLAPAGAVVSSEEAESVLRTPALHVTVRHDPLRIAFATAGGERLDEDDPERGIAVAGTQVKAWKRLEEQDRVYGLGQKAGRLDKRGRGLGGYGYAMWNTDAYGYDAGTDPLYVSVPFYLVLRQGRAFGIFLDNTHRTTFDIGKESPERLAFGAEGGELDYYFIYGPAPKQVIARYSALTGRMPLPPLWALGYHQCRYSYYPDSRLRELARQFRERRIPADALWLDIHYQDRYKPFTWDPQRFPDPAGLVRDLKGQGFRVVTILDPHPKKESGYAPYDSGLAGWHFVRNSDGSVYEAPVWPSLAETDPGDSVFPDFSRPGTRAWWGELHRGLAAIGVAGIWNDMNEPAVFRPPSGTMPLGVRHDNEGAPTDHREIHNVYGMLMTRATHEGLRRLRPDARPFVLTRASFAGGQRYAAAWPGDNASDWSHLRLSLPALLGMGVSGMPFVGSDIGGFAGVASAELFTRWLQLGVFYPFMRAHKEVGTPDHEPWSFGARHEAVNRRAIELRYELLPYIYNVMREASETGTPALRPLFLEYPGDERTYAIEDELLFGADLLVAPVMREVTTERELYLPASDWFDFWTGGRLAGGRQCRVPVTLESIPIFVRAGAFLFRQPVIQHTGERQRVPLVVSVFPAAASEAELYEDAGDGLDYQRGAFLRRRFAQRRDERSIVVEIGPAAGSWRPADRRLELHLAATGPPARVLVAGRVLARSDAHPGPDTWGVGTNGAVEVRLADRFDRFEVRLEAARASADR